MPAREDHQIVGVDDDVGLETLPETVGAFPELGAGRRPLLSFRGLLGVHSHYGLPDRSAACAAFVTRLRPGSCPPTVARQLPSPIDIGSCGFLLPLGL